jgi:putative ABC transport system substrate-binding protein
MRRRDFITLVGGAAATWPLAARAQQPERMRRVGVLMGYPENDLEGPAFFAAFREGLEKLGWVEGRNIRLCVQVRLACSAGNSPAGVEVRAP